MNEKVMERKFREEIRKRGGKALKFSSPYYTGMPDRVILMPGGRMYFAEIKSTGKTPTARQERVIQELKSLGFEAYVIDDQAGFDEFLERVDRSGI